MLRVWIMFGVLLLSVSGCNGPDREVRIGSLKLNHAYLSTGAFREAIEIPVPQAGASPVQYVQGGTLHPSLSTVDSTQPQCRFTVQKMKFTAPDLIRGFGVNRVTLTRKESFFNQAEVAQVRIFRRANGLNLELKFRVDLSHYSRDLYYNVEWATASLNLDCARTGNGLGAHETDLLTVGELMEIFGFEYIWEAPSV